MKRAKMNENIGQIARASNKPLNPVITSLSQSTVSLPKVAAIPAIRNTMKKLSPKPTTNIFSNERLAILCEVMCIEPFQPSERSTGFH